MLSSQPEAKAAKWPPRIVIAAPQGRSGKTTISLGLCAAFSQRGLIVQPFKKGPDYIDPSWLTAAANRGCRNLDIFLIPEEKLLLSFQRACGGADLAVIEGAMGLYDSLDLEGSESTAQVSRLLHSPVVLVVNATRMTRSVAAMVAGYQQFEPNTDIAGVVLNNVSSRRHESKMIAAIEKYCGIPVVGSMPRDHNLNITQRHLGLVPYVETEEAASIIERITERVKNGVNLDGILAIANRGEAQWIQTVNSKTEIKTTGVRIGVMTDRVFSFYYPENLEALHQAGAELVFVDSLRDQKLPDIDGLYIGGGFPELALDELEANSALRLDIAHVIRHGLPVYAECAGLMYLSQAIHWHGQRYEMVGALPCEVEICQRPQGHGYVEAEIVRKNPLFPVGLKLRGHQFHYSRLLKIDGLDFVYELQRSRGTDKQIDGIVYRNVFAAYTHLHALGVPQWAEAFVSLALRERRPSATFSSK